MRVATLLTGSFSRGFAAFAHSNSKREIGRCLTAYEEPVVIVVTPL